VVGPAFSGFLVAYAGFSFVYLLDALCSFSFFLWSYSSAAARKKETRATRAREESHGRAAVCVQQKSNSRYDYPGFVCRSAWRCDGVDADLCGSNSSLRPVGLGWMRAMPAVGAFMMALLIAHLPPMKHAGKTLLWCVIGFGVSTILFGLSKIFWLSLGVLFLIGAFDSVSVIIRGSIVQLVTPDEMRGRVIIGEQYFHRHLERVRRAGIGIDRGAIWAGHFGRGRRDRNDPCRAGRWIAVARDAKDRRAGSDSALSIKERRLPSRRSLSYNQNAPCNEIVP